MAKINATDFKARCLELMDRVSERRETFVITKRGKAVAQLVSVERQSEEPLFGRLRGMAEEAGDIGAAVVPATAWETLSRSCGHWYRRPASRCSKLQSRLRRWRPSSRQAFQRILKIA